MSKKVLIAMSGGVDSSVTALLMQSEGYDCIGCTMKLYDKESDTFSSSQTCGSASDVEDARSIAQLLGIPFNVLDFQEDFKHCVIDKFIRCYEEGTTPNPCIECNRCMKFERLISYAKTLGCEKIATGHYVRCEYDAESGRYLLKKALDPAKDQSYVLYMLTQDELAHVCFPLGGMTKAEARAIAEEHGFVNSKKHDSQDICFVPDGDYTAFMERYTGRSYPAGDFLNENGDVIGTHRGAVRYTIGQRKGLGLSMAHPVYVYKKDMEKNAVYVGDEDLLFKKELTATDFNWIAWDVPPKSFRAQAKARYRQTAQWAQVFPQEDNTVKIIFDEPQRAITPGQAVVLYSDDIVLGGGTII